VLHVLGDGRVTQFGEVVRAPVPLQPGNLQVVEEALHDGNGAGPIASSKGVPTLRIGLVASQCVRPSPGSTR